MSSTDKSTPLKPKKDLNYWRSFEDLHQKPAALQAKANEFMKGVTDDFDINELSGVSRRQFLALVGASAAVAGAGCDWRDMGEVVPYNRKPEGVVAGRPSYYASAVSDGGESHAVLVKTREGRPIKIDGNPEHPVSQGKTNARVQAMLMDLYDPGRLRYPVAQDGDAFKQVEGGWAKVDAYVGGKLAAAKGKTIALVANKINSPFKKHVIDQFIKANPSAKLYTYELFNNSVKDAAWKASYGSGVFPLIKWEDAKVIVSLEADILSGADGAGLSAMRAVAKNRDIDRTGLDDFVRLYQVEGNQSMTGMAADYRLRLRTDRQLEFAQALLAAVKSAKAGALSGVSEGFTTAFAQMAKDLVANKGKSIVFAGRALGEDVQKVVNEINAALGNQGLYDIANTPAPVVQLSSDDAWKGLVADMNASKVAAVIHLDSNPVYHLPPSLGYAAALAKVETRVAFTALGSEKEAGSETAAASNLILPVSHALESWGDAQSLAKVYDLQQPAMAPLYDSRQVEGALLAWSGKTYSDRLVFETLKGFWQTSIYNVFKPAASADAFFSAALHDGFVGSPNAAMSVGAFKAAPAAKAAVPKGKVVVLSESLSQYDGRFANNGWLQETPHPVSKVVWDNYAAVSIDTAKALGLKLFTTSYDQGYFSTDKLYDLITVTVGSATLTLPAFVQPGVADDVIAIELGYGRTAAGEVAKNGSEKHPTTGFDANVLRGAAGVNDLLLTGATVAKASGQYNLVSTQEHHSIDPGDVTERGWWDKKVKVTENISGSEDGKGGYKGMHSDRDIIIEDTIAGYKAHQKDADYMHHKKNIHIPEVDGKEGIDSLNPAHKYPGHKWGMAINLNTCTSCNACVTSCNAENNIPVVGKEQTARGREMHWMRIDRYYAGTPQEPKASVQPMICQHCDNAPCENVCPVVATSHSPEGINEMTYNRCVGTRYCANNCPYKVRRFNFLNFRNEVGREGLFGGGYYQKEPADLLHNPEVTVRSRGVMEKCTFCLQRIYDAKQLVKEQGRGLIDGDVKTACQEACPSDAIVFGDINDPSSHVSKLRKSNLGYHVLEQLNVVPNVTYLARLRNIEEA